MPGLTGEEHALIEAQTVPFYVGNRTRSTALLAWFIEHVMREDPDAVEDAICDGGGDKGIRSSTACRHVDGFRARFSL